MDFASLLKGFPLELGISARGEKRLNGGTTGPSKKFDDIISSLDAIHQRDRQTDGRTNIGRQQRSRLITHNVAQ